MNHIYLDHAAATPVDEQVFAAMQPYFTDKFYNPSATYLTAQEVRKDLEAARARVAQTLGSKPVDITFTAGGTEANNLAIHGIMQRFPGANMVVGSIEHDAVLAPAQRYSHALAPVTPEGVIDLTKLEKCIDDQTVLLSIMYANNEVGTIQPIAKVAQLVQRIRKARQAAGNTLPLYLHTDACQAALYLDLHVSRLGVDLMTINGGKMYGPKQSGVLYAASTIVLEPHITGGGQERNRRSGTENVAFAVGFSYALEAAQAQRHDEGYRLQQLQHLFSSELRRAFPKAIINGSQKLRLPNNIHVTFPGIDNETLLMQLDEAGIQAAAGSACSASNEEPSHVLRAMGIGEVDAQSSIRFTMGRSTSSADMAHVAQVLQKLITS